MSTAEAIHAKYVLLSRYLTKRQCALWAAAEAQVVGRGGIKLVMAATGLPRKIIAAHLPEIRKVAYELPGSAAPNQPTERRGRKRVEIKFPGIEKELEKLLENEIAGDPMSEQKWARSSLRRLSKRLEERGFQACTHTVARMLRKMGLSLKANKRRQAGSQCPDRDEQFRYIASQRQHFLAANSPTISVDSKKRELIGPFRSDGRIWCRKATEVDEHNFASAAEYSALPFGVYDLLRNTGYVVVGLSHNTPEFAVSAIARWWNEEGKVVYPNASELFVLADGGGSNGARVWAWKYNIQVKLCDAFGLTVTVSHYPTGCSKWNPVEYRLFSQITINWAGIPLTSLDLMLGYIRGTTTAAGLRVTALRDEGVYRKKQKVTWDERKRLNVKGHDVCPKWNYTIAPRTTPKPSPCTATSVEQCRVSNGDCD